MRHCTIWILSIILGIVLVQLPTNTTSEYIQPKYNEVPKEVMIFYSSGTVQGFLNIDFLDLSDRRYGTFVH